MTLSIAFLVLVMAVTGLSVWRFLRWKHELITALRSRSLIAATPKGPIEYQIYGDTGEYVLFFHGAPGGYDQYALHSNAFFDKFRVISISRFGYLRTPLSTAMNLPDQTDALASFLDWLKVDRVNLLAGSGGGPLALAFAAYHPNRISRIVLYAVASQAMVLENNRPGVRLLKSITRSDFLSWLFFVPLMRKPEKFVKMLIKDEKNRAAIIASGLADQFAQSISVMLPPSLRNPGMENDERIMKHLDIPKYNIVAPTLIVHGNQDEHVPYAHSQLLHQQIPHSQLVTIEDGDHFAGYIHNGFLDQVYKEFFTE